MGEDHLQPFNLLRSLLCIQLGISLLYSPKSRPFLPFELFAPQSHPRKQSFGRYAICTRCVEVEVEVEVLDPLVTDGVCTISTDLGISEPRNAHSVLSGVSLAHELTV